METEKGNYYHRRGEKLVITPLYGDEFEVSSEQEVDRWYEENFAKKRFIKVDRQNIELYDIYKSLEKSRKHLLSIRIFVNVAAILLLLGGLMTFINE
jgi:hypothetical protein